MRVRVLVKAFWAREEVINNNKSGEVELCFFMGCTFKAILLAEVCLNWSVTLQGLHQKQAKCKMYQYPISSILACGRRCSCKHESAVMLLLLLVDYSLCS